MFPSGDVFFDLNRGVHDRFGQAEQQIRSRQKPLPPDKKLTDKHVLGAFWYRPLARAMKNPFRSNDYSPPVQRWTFSIAPGGALIWLIFPVGEKRLEEDGRRTAVARFLSFRIGGTNNIGEIGRMQIFRRPPGQSIRLFPSFESPVRGRRKIR